MKTTREKKGYTDAPRDVVEAIDTAETVKDFLPPPNELRLREATTKVTISLTKRSVSFFKRSAARRGLPYQAMIRKILDLYAQRYDDGR